MLAILEQSLASGCSIVDKLTSDHEEKKNIFYPFGLNKNTI